MCGIAVVVSVGQVIAPETAARMAETLRHRGPDDEGAVELAHCQLGHRRLAVVDIAGGLQPMRSETRPLWITFNGEIYNYREVREALVRAGRTFRTHSDTEVVLQGYEEFGDAVVDRLNGQFAFALWDEERARLFAARDRLGEKPLYRASLPDGTLMLASELKALVASGRLSGALDPSAVEAYLALNYVPPDLCIYRDVEVFPPGHTLSWERGVTVQRRYWEPRYATIEPTIEEAAVEVRRLLEASVDRQMRADVQVGAFLSGGVDSTAVTALMAQRTTLPVSTFSVGFGELIDELPFAREVADRYSTKHHELQMDIPVGEMVERMALVYDEPFGDSSNIPTYLVAGFAADRLKVVLSGDGGDELFGGYEWYRGLSAGEGSRLREATLAARMLGLRAATKLGVDVSSRVKRTWFDAAAARAARAAPDVWGRHVAFVSGDPARRAAGWGGVAVTPAAELLRHLYRPGAAVSGLDNAVDFDVRCYLPGDILVKVDRATMAHGLEARSPFLDVDLAEFVLSLPAPLRVDVDSPKRLLRLAVADLLPPSVAGRPKQGFGAPVERWLERPDVAAIESRAWRAAGPLRHLLPGLPEQPQPLTSQERWNLLALGTWLDARPVGL